MSASPYWFRPLLVFMILISEYIIFAKQCIAITYSVTRILAFNKRIA